MGRVLCEYAHSPIVFVAPHGYSGDDYNTELLAAKAANHIKANYLINVGWQRHYSVDELKDKADCNNTRHVTHEVLMDEFLLPFKRMCLRAKKNFKECLVVFIHGVSDKIRQTSGIIDLDIILGYGLGKPNSTTCPEIIKNKFMRTSIKNSPKVLGLDISTKTIGWALFDIQTQELLELTHISPDP